MLPQIHLAPENEVTMSKEANVTKGQAKKTYQSPTFTCYGSIEDLTEGGEGSPEGEGGNKNKRP
jgi:hypothetical protein